MAIRALCSVQCRADNARNLHFSCLQYENHEQARLAQSLPKSESDNCGLDHIYQGAQSQENTASSINFSVKSSGDYGLSVGINLKLHWIV